MAHIRLVIVLILCLGLLVSDSRECSAQRDREFWAKIDRWNELNRETQSLYRWGKYMEAIPVGLRALEFAVNNFDQLAPPLRISYLTRSMNNLAMLCEAEDKYGEAEALYKRSLMLSENGLGPDDPAVAESLENLAVLYQSQGKYAEAAPFFRRSWEIPKKKWDVPKGGVDVERLYKDQLARDETVLGPEHPDVASSLNGLAELYRRGWKFTEAEPLYTRSLAIREKVLGPEHPDTVRSLNGLAELYWAQERYSEAEPLYRRYVAISGEALRVEDKLEPLRNLAELYRAQGRYAEAEALYKRLLAIEEKRQDDVLAAGLLDELGQLRAEQGDQKAAMEYFERSLALYERRGLYSRSTLNLIAHLHMDMGDLTHAEPIVRAAGDDVTKGRFHLLKGEYEAARDQYEMFRQRRTQFDKHGNDLFVVYSGLGLAYEGLGDNPKAAEQYRSAVDLSEELRWRFDPAERTQFFGTRLFGLSRISPYEGLARVLLKMGNPIESLRSSECGKARSFSERISMRLQEMHLDIPGDVLDSDKGLNGLLADLKKDRGIIVGIPPWKTAPDYAESITDRGQKEAIADREIKLTRLQRCLKAYIRTLHEKYPLIAAIKYPQPMDLDQTALKEDERVLAYDVTDSGVLIYLTKGKKILKAVFKPVPRKKLDELVNNFMGPLESELANKTLEQFAEKLKSFDFASGRELSKILLDDILLDLPQGQPLILVPDDCLGVLPLEMLVLNSGGEVNTDIKDAPDTGKPTVHAWVKGPVFFGDRYPISYCQSITALTLARNHAKPAGSQNKMLVVADPVFDLKDKRAQAARGTGHLSPEEQRLYKELYTNMAGTKESGGGGLHFWPLPLTGKLAEVIGKIYRGDCDVYTGLEASKEHFMQKIKPKLAEYDQVIFATHGYFGDDIPGINEPVLLLTLVPPGTDGYLRMSDIVRLKLNADMIALTACRTGVGLRFSGEGTMGMGRAFQYAGAKSVLISLWSVAEESSVKLVESFFKHRKDNKNKLEALKLARKEIREQGYDHPFFWAPFILVGEVD
jgi:tetratricopeptide (TPR) repeat protein